MWHLIADMCVVYQNWYSKYIYYFLKYELLCVWDFPDIPFFLLMKIFSA